MWKGTTSLNNNDATNRNKLCIYKPARDNDACQFIHPFSIATEVKFYLDNYVCFSHRDKFTDVVALAVAD
jgi:hypothetical protein